MTKPFDPTKPVQTRDGRPARIICTDRKGRRPIGALVGDDDEVVWTMKDGVPDGHLDIFRPVVAAGRGMASTGLEIENRSYGNAE